MHKWTLSILVVLTFNIAVSYEQAEGRGPRGFARQATRRAAPRAGAAASRAGGHALSHAAAAPRAALSGHALPSGASALHGIGGAGMAGAARPQAASMFSNRPNAVAQQFRNGLPSTLQGRAGNLQHAAQSAFSTWGSGPKPFSPAWYAQHPNAWKATHPYAPAAAVALTTAGVAAWLAAPLTGTGTATSTTVNVVEEPAQDTSETAADPAAAPAETPVAAGPAPAAESWMPLGIYVLSAPGETMPTRMVELALAKDGRIGGTYYDRLQNSTQTVTGQMDRATMMLRWHVGAQGSVFESTVDALSNPETSITVRFPDGAVAAWRFVRQEQPVPGR